VAKSAARSGARSKAVSSKKTSAAKALVKPKKAKPVRKLAARSKVAARKVTPVRKPPVALKKAKKPVKPVLVKSKAKVPHKPVKSVPLKKITRVKHKVVARAKAVAKPAVKPKIKPAAVKTVAKKPGKSAAAKPVIVQQKPDVHKGPNGVNGGLNGILNGKPKKNPAGLSAKELAQYAAILLQKRREIVGDMRSMEIEALGGAGSGGLSSLPVHMADMGTDNYEQEFTLGLVEKDRVLLREINHALAKIQAGTYGICEGTGVAIGRARLEFQPWAKYSIEFARQREKTGMGVRPF
jgi:DnaK suppressor protein